MKTKNCFCTKRGNKCMYHANFKKEQKQQTTTLNPNNAPMKDEAIIDIFSSGMGGYMGSFCVPKKDKERYAFAINTAGNLLINGIQTNKKPITARIRI